MDYEERHDVTVFCECCERGPGGYGEEGRAYVSYMCTGEPKLNSGKAHHHCKQCSGFGQCMGDIRMTHCPDCHEHYWEGLAGSDCPNCYEDDRFREAQRMFQ